VSVLIVDNYDSFTYNLFQVLGTLSGAEPIVRRNDAIGLDEIRALRPSHIVISPGPGSPDKARDFGVSAEVIVGLRGTVPILGVCLGHQGIIHHLGGRVVRAPEPMHGKVSRIRNLGGRLFEGLGAELEVMRYHSLIGARPSLPGALKVVAETIGDGDGLVMAVDHETWPMFGIQFHPESIGTPDGPRLLANFLKVRA
jgi:anthranilate synthase component 2